MTLSSFADSPSTSTEATLLTEMENRWDASRTFDGPLDECAYGSRLIGRDPALVLHGGGNTSVKAPFLDITGDEIPALWVKGSGWDLASIAPAGFPALRLARLHRLLDLETLSDPDMMRELAAARLDPGAPQPSVESLLHAFLPHEAVQHSHADVIVTLTNLADGARLIREVFGEFVVIVPYVMPGFDLARAVRDLWPQQATGNSIGMVLLNHGLFTFGATTEEAYGTHVDLITRAEDWLGGNAPHRKSKVDPLPPADVATLAALRKEISDAAGAPMIGRRHTDPAVARFVRRQDLPSLAQRGPLTPDHVIRTKRLPMIGRDVEAFADEYRRYFQENEDRGRVPLSMLDPAPRVVLDPEIGMVALGRTAGDAAIVADIYHHTIPVLERSEDHLGGYQALSAADLFDAEYWDLEQAKLRRASAPPEFTGMVALVTGAASGIGRACAAELLARGAAVAGLDRTPSVVGAFEGPAWLGVSVDLVDPAAQEKAMAETVEAFGGIDIVVAAAGVFGASESLASLQAESWRQVMAINTDSVAELFHLVDPILRMSPVGGRVAVISSKNVPAPGPGAAAYSASKAAVTQLARVAALEWAAAGIRVNVVHPDAVFDTGLWTEELIAERASRYGLTTQEYKRRNLLRLEITSETVANVVADLCSDRFRATTGAQIPIDGGSERVI
jgi:rhamnose utilization protein RhaD (predicted bifunctional aldolase and dehydrogenase)/NAD(P)-dependent dehydrogenase (short-subunit alcohol dehydrogenase family)